MNDTQLAKETRKQRRCEVLGTNDPRCGTCGHHRWPAIEKHHPADYGRDETTVLICRNCHRVLSDDQKDHPAFDPNADSTLDAIGHFLLGLEHIASIATAKKKAKVGATAAQVSASPAQPTGVLGDPSALQAAVDQSLSSAIKDTDLRSALGVVGNSGHCKG